MPNNKVLIVDDDENALILLRTFLEISNYEVVATSDPYEALLLARTEEPTLVLLDIMMPKMDGFTLCQKMRAYPQLRSLPIYFVTAYEAMDMRVRASDVGATGVVEKPIHLRKVEEIISKHVMA